MTTAIDTNVFVALWDQDEPLNPVVRPALDAAMGHGSLIVAAPVYCELLAYPSRSEDFLERFFGDTGIFVDWNLDETIWKAAGHAFQGYVARRRKHRDSGPRRLLADFLIGAHAVQNGFPLLTLDDRIYRAAFPRLTLINVRDA